LAEFTIGRDKLERLMQLNTFSLVYYFVRYL